MKRREFITLLGGIGGVIGLAPYAGQTAEDIRDLQRWTGRGVVAPKSRRAFTPRGILKASMTTNVANTLRCVLWNRRSDAPWSKALTAVSVKIRLDCQVI
jgi:hypothetical protein